MQREYDDLNKRVNDPAVPHSRLTLHASLRSFLKAVAPEPDTLVKLDRDYEGDRAEAVNELLESRTFFATHRSPRDTGANVWMTWAGSAKTQIGADEEATTWLRRGIEANRNLPVGHFFSAGALVLVNRHDEARRPHKRDLCWTQALPSLATAPAQRAIP